jgi:hypothetical protein
MPFNATDRAFRPYMRLRGLSYKCVLTGLPELLTLQLEVWSEKVTLRCWYR